MNAFEQLAKRWNDESHQCELAAIQTNDDLMSATLNRQAAELRMRACELELAIIEDKLNAITHNRMGTN